MVKVMVRNQSWKQGKWDEFGTYPDKAQAERAAKELSAEAARELTGLIYKVVTPAEEARKQRANASRRARHDALTSLGLTRVRGNLGGVYYE
jgi:hypothetical protein